MFLERSRIFENKRDSAPAERQQVQEAPARQRQQQRQRAMQRQERARMPANEMRDDGDGGKDALATDQFESSAARQLPVLVDRTIAGMLEFRCGADQAPAQQELDARLQMRQVRDRHEQLAARLEYAVQLGERARLFLERQMLEHIEAQRVIERPVGER